jgi:hypothetical protein
MFETLFFVHVNQMQIVIYSQRKPEKKFGGLEKKKFSCFVPSDAKKVSMVLLTQDVL